MAIRDIGPYIYLPADMNPKAPRKSFRADFRFYGPLNDFLALEKRHKTIPYEFNGRPSIKDAVEAQGIPHPEVDLIVINGRIVGFGDHLKPADRVAVYPQLRSVRIPAHQRLQPPPLVPARFVLDVHLGKLARSLRLLGLDTYYGNNLDDPEIVDISAKQSRTILTRDRRLLYTGRVTYGYWVRSENPKRQVTEILERYDLHQQIRPLSRCTHCNGLIHPVTKAEVNSLLEPKTRLYYDVFCRCEGCGQIYWKGSHHQRLMNWVAGLQQGPDRLV